MKPYSAFRYLVGIKNYEFGLYIADSQNGIRILGRINLSKENTVVAENKIIVVNSALKSVVSLLVERGGIFIGMKAVAVVKSGSFNFILLPLKNEGIRCHKLTVFRKIFNERLFVAFN